MSLPVHQPALVHSTTSWAEEPWGSVMSMAGRKLKKEEEKKKKNKEKVFGVTAP